MTNKAFIYYDCSDLRTHQVLPFLGHWLKRSNSFLSSLFAAVTCDSSMLPPPENGIKNGCPHSEETYGTTCTLICNVGFMPTQPTYVTCTDDGNGVGEWNGNTITCEGWFIITTSAYNNKSVNIWTQLVIKVAREHWKKNILVAQFIYALSGA